MAGWIGQLSDVVRRGVGHICVLVDSWRAIYRSQQHTTWTYEQCHQRQPQTLDCLILSLLPADLILQIADHLGPDGQAFFSQTCHILRALLRRTPKPDDLPEVPKRRYLGVLAKDRPDRYVCYGCGSLHRVGWIGILCTAWRDSIYCPHIQIALKHLRLNKRDWKHYICLSSILRPRLVRPLIWRYGRPRRYLICSRYPKVVEGRFLVMTQWTNITRHAFKMGMESFYILADVHYMVHPWYKTRDALRMCSNAATDEPLNLLDPISPSYFDMNRGVVGYDSESPTDMLFCMEDKEPQLYIWQDLGTENAPLYFAWERSEFREGMGVKDLRAGLAPGEVRRLYESDGKGKRAWPSAIKGGEDI
ncbi:hypothetical protein NM208_g11650 [Fusarium decemcellulare]|uniref:Uncharacterized protein n=1 Tax=Fusarium decemcellulare TaxID=57161 RepID=A0ACC1RU30_9HYPO|nr:hypothetical protein NM208_g11650 [Fusarium decemcellulare]